jgi:hypothetical protein
VGLFYLTRVAGLRHAARKVLNVFCSDIAIYKSQTESGGGLVRTQDPDVG